MKKNLLVNFKFTIGTIFFIFVILIFNFYLKRIILAGFSGPYMGRIEVTSGSGGGATLIVGCNSQAEKGVSYGHSSQLPTADYYMLNCDFISGRGESYSCTYNPNLLGGKGGCVVNVSSSTEINCTSYCVPSKNYPSYTKNVSVTAGSNGGGATTYICKNDGVTPATTGIIADAYVSQCICASGGCAKEGSSCSYISGFDGKGGCRAFNPGVSEAGSTSTTTCKMTCLKYTASTPTTTPSLTLTPTPPTGTLTPSPTTITPTLTPACVKKTLGDANCDGKVNGVDFSLWLNRQCTTGCLAENLKADFNTDNKVDDDDYSIWFNNRE